MCLARDLMVLALIEHQMWSTASVFDFCGRLSLRCNNLSRSNSLQTWPLKAALRPPFIHIFECPLCFTLSTDNGLRFFLYLTDILNFLQW